MKAEVEGAEGSPTKLGEDGEPIVEEKKVVEPVEEVIDEEQRFRDAERKREEEEEAK